MKKLFSYFLQGLLLIAPVGITIYALIYTFSTIDGLLAVSLEKIIGFNVPGLGILLLFIFITLLGLIGQTALVKPFKQMTQRIITRIPLLNLLYSSLNDLLSAFVGKEKKFNVPVKVLFNAENDLWKMGFITKENLDEIEQPDHSSVYFPHSYNFSGELYLIPNDRIFKIEISPAQTMKFIVSGGVTNID
ncbi:MAG: DUF502 domain-containing protein [Prolixibacteraceae bacterium]